VLKHKSTNAQNQGTGAPKDTEKIIYKNYYKK
jgi:hypothetical protein